MIKGLLPLTKNKLEILKTIYEKEETHLLEIAKLLKTHPYSCQRTLAGLKTLLKEKTAGRTKIISLNKEWAGYTDLSCIIEDYRLTTSNKTVNSVIKHLANMFPDVTVCCLFGSYARLSFTQESDIDVLLVAREKTPTLKRRISQLSAVLDREVTPLILTENEFTEALKKREPTIMSLKKPSQRLIVTGARYFLEKLNKS